MEVRSHMTTCERERPEALTCGFHRIAHRLTCRSVSLSSTAFILSDVEFQGLAWHDHRHGPELVAEPAFVRRVVLEVRFRDVAPQDVRQLGHTGIWMTWAAYHAAAEPRNARKM